MLLRRCALLGSIDSMPCVGESIGVPPKRWGTALLAEAAVKGFKPVEKLLTPPLHISTLTVKTLRARRVALRTSLNRCAAA
jgi:hypothetical protein